MKNIMLVTEKSWHNVLFANLQNKITAEWKRVSKKDEFTYDRCKDINPDWIFIPHWSYLIQEEIFDNFNCVVFHMTDLPYGRGGSPLQNLIVRGHKETKISAISVTKEIDAGDIYLKRPLSLLGTAEEIFMRSAGIIEEMIVDIVSNKPLPKEQEGEIIHFERRKPEDGNIDNVNTIEDIYDYIRMLDCEGYPKAFLETDKFKFEFNRASLKADNSIIADVRISKK